ncbi:lactaldehyde reductase [Natronobacillus azotifigens]|uniref:Lactaldehyde reductase n=1 Tax=Natronobacillus azotifigens TaxID=472978 RepID=A0A9J6RBG9_9BACI|nr:lactaldehyde reductase [Natronobacillus azotifigens]MCZ0703032.1 lactaldehyde reductase [Natronobacillus azotifigens]
MVNRMILNETSYFGEGAIEELPKEIQKRQFNNVFIITDKQLVKIGLIDTILALLDKYSINYTVFDEIDPNPSIENVKKGLSVFKEKASDCILAFGGGSPQDAAKAIGIIATNPEFADVRSLEGVADTKHPSQPIFAVPTTSGTAAEVTINYVITDKENKRKFVCVDPHDIPIVSFVDADFMLGMPKALAAATGMDALTHAIEGYITQAAWEMTDMLHLKAIEIIGRSLRDSTTGNPEAREEMALGQYIAGMGFSNVGLGLAHGMAHPLSAHYDLPHGVACAMLLPLVMEFNKPFVTAKYHEIAKALKVHDVHLLSEEEAADAACEAVRTLSKDVDIPTSLSDLGIQVDNLDQLVKDAQNDVCTPGNPRPVNIDDIRKIYLSIL